MALRIYSFQIRTVKDLSAPSSQQVLVNFEFLAEDDESAKKYMQSLINHYSDNGLCVSQYPYENTDLISKEY